MTTMTGMTYGTLPTFEEFEKAFRRELDHACYEIHLGKSDSEACEGYGLGDGYWDVNQLWGAITEIVNRSAGDAITVSEDSEFEDVYQIFYPGTDRPYMEIGPEADELIEWANRFGADIASKERAIETLNYAAAYGQTGTDWTRFETRMDLVSAILETLGFEWI